MVTKTKITEADGGGYAKTALVDQGDGTHAPRVATVQDFDPIGVNPVYDATEVIARRTDYVTCLAGATTPLVGEGIGAKGDILDGFLVFCTVAATGTLTLKDGDGTGGAINGITLVAANEMTPGTWKYIDMRGRRSKNGRWEPTFGAGLYGFADGYFR